VRARPKCSVEFLSSVFLISPEFCDVTPCSFVQLSTYCSKLLHLLYLKKDAAGLTEKSVHRVTCQTTASTPLNALRAHSTGVTAGCSSTWTLVILSKALRRYVNVAVNQISGALLRSCASCSCLIECLRTLSTRLPRNQKFAQFCLCVCRLQADGVLASANLSRSGQTGFPKMHRDVVGSGTHTNTVQITWQNWQLPIC